MQIKRFQSASLSIAALLIMFMSATANAHAPQPYRAHAVNRLHCSAVLDWHVVRHSHLVAKRIAARRLAAAAVHHVVYHKPVRRVRYWY